MMAATRLLHAWAGAILSLLVIVVALTGSALVFKEDWLRATVPEARTAVQPTAAALGQAAERLERDRVEGLRRVVFAGTSLGIQQVFLTGERYAYADSSGRVVAEWTGTGRPETLIYELHHFLLAGERGMKVVGVLGLLLIGFVLSGLVLWAPSWRGFAVRIWPQSAKRRDLLGVHRHLGALAALPITIFAVSGVGLTFYQTTQSWLERALPGREEEMFFPPSSAGDIDWPRALTAAHARYPAATLRMITWPTGDGWPAIVQLRQPGEWNPLGHTKVYLDPSSSEVIATSDPRTLGRGLKLYRLLYPLHVASPGGRPYDVLAFLTGLALAALGLFGLWSFLQQRTVRPD